MDILSALASVLLTLVGYSSGRVLARFKYKVTPSVLDIIIITLLWVGVLWTRNDLGKWWAILIWLFIGGIAGFLFSLIVRDGQPTERPTVDATSLFRRVWEGWKNFAQVMGDFQGRVLLIWFYFVIVTPFGLIARFGVDPLHLKENTGNSFWKDFPVKNEQLEVARKQY
jgi:hypothetical protein